MESRNKAATSAKRIESFAQAFLKACRVEGRSPRRRPQSAKSFFVQLIRRGMGNPSQGVQPLATLIHDSMCPLKRFRCDNINSASSSISKPADSNNSCISAKASSLTDNLIFNTSKPPFGSICCNNYSITANQIKCKSFFIACTDQFPECKKRHMKK